MKLLTTTELARKLGVCKRQVYVLRDRGELPSPLRIGRKTLRWSEETIDRWLASLDADEREGKEGATAS